MRRTRTLCFLILFLALSVGNSPLMGQSLHEKLEGRWKMDLEEVVASMEPSKKSMFEKLPELKQNEFKESISSREFIFEKNGIFKALWNFRGDTFSSSGVWGINENGKTLSITFPEKTVSYEIKELAEVLVLDPLNSQRGMIGKLIFRKEL